MIKNIIFDFGDIFINLDKLVVVKAIAAYGFSTPPDELVLISNSYETGHISSEEFLEVLCLGFRDLNKKDIKAIWNSMLLDFPDYRLEFLEALKAKREYRMFLLSNTNEIHIERVISKMGKEKYGRFKNCFEGFYLSHEIGLRKPDISIFEYVLNINNLKADQTLFIDDTEENTIAAGTLNIQTWNLRVGQEDIIDLKNKL